MNAHSDTQAALQNRAPQDHAPEVLRIPGWEDFPWLRAGFSTRHGGLSHAYGTDEGNLGWTAQDNPALVKANRERFVRTVAGEAPMALVTVGQVHGAVVRDLEIEPAPWRIAEGKTTMEGDGLISRTPGRLLAILTADCVPVLVADTRTHALGAFHAGWRGTRSRIVESGISRMQEAYGSRAEDLVAAIGPCIGACCFEVGDEVRSAFESEFAYAPELFRAGPAGTPRYMDLVEANARQLIDAGLPVDSLRVLRVCTACARRADGRRRFFSYRAEHGVTGRMLSAIGAAC